VGVFLLVLLASHVYGIAGFGGEETFALLNSAPPSSPL